MTDAPGTLGATRSTSRMAFQTSSTGASTSNAFSNFISLLRSPQLSLCNLVCVGQSAGVVSVQGRFSPPLNRSPGDRHLPRTAWCGAAVPRATNREATMATSQTAMLRALLAGALAAVALLAPSAARAADGVVASVEYPGVQHLHYRY